MARREYTGLLAIGDPHVEGKVPGFRKDDYPQVVLDKLAWCLSYAQKHRLLPALLGDLFHLPRNNPNWLVGDLIEVLGSQQVIGIFGNHDAADPVLSEHDSFSLLIRSGRISLVSAEAPWVGRMNGRAVVVGGSSYRERVPESYSMELETPEEARTAGESGRLWESEGLWGTEAEGGVEGAGETEPDTPLVLWLAHHDIGVPGYEEQGRFLPHEIPGIDAVINGHIHRHLEAVEVGSTSWLTPGNISRRVRTDAIRDHVPSALRIDVDRSGWNASHVAIPHRPFDEIFHEAVADETLDTSESAFVAGLAELEARKTASGAGFMEFIQKNLDQFDEPIAAEILVLAKEVTTDVTTEDGNAVD